MWLPFGIEDLAAASAAGSAVAAAEPAAAASAAQHPYARPHGLHAAAQLTTTRAESESAAGHCCS